MARSIRFIATAILGFAISPVSAQQVKVPADIYGDPLPEGAMARLGTVRFRHGRSAQAVGFAHGGKVLASAGQDGIRLWDAKSGCLLHEVKNYSFSQSLAISPDGAKLFNGLSMIDVASGKETLTFIVPRNFLGQAIAFASDGLMVASCGPDGQIILWDARTAKELRRTEVQAQNVATKAIAFAPAGGNRLATACTDNMVRILDCATGKLIHRLEGHTRPVTCVNFAPDGQTVVSGGEDGVIRFWDAKTGKPLHEIEQECALVMAVVYSPNGKLLATTGTGGAISLWDPATRKVVRRWETHSSNVSSVAFSPDGKTLATVWMAAIRLWNVATGEEITPRAAHAGVVKALHFAPDGRSLFSFGQDRKAFDWDIATGRDSGRLLQGTLKPTGPEYWPVLDLSPNGKVAAQISGIVTEKADFAYQPVVRLWDTVTGKQIHGLEGHGERVTSLKFSADGKLLVSCGRDGDVRLWDTLAGKELHHLPARVRMFTPAFSSDGKVLATLGDDGTLSSWDTATGKKIRHGSIEQDNMSHIAFSPDGKSILIGGHAFIYVWDIASGKEIRRFRSEFLPMGGLAFSPNGRVLVGAGFNFQRTNELKFNHGVIRLWEMQTGQPIRTIYAHEGWITSMALASDGRTLATGGEDSSILIWDLTGHANAKPLPLTPARLDQLWGDLRADAAKADRAIWDLAFAPQQGVPFLKERLQPVAPLDDKQTAKLLAELESTMFNVRQAAERKLIKRGESVELALRTILAGNPSLELRRRVEQILEKRGPDALRQLRAIDALEQIGTPDARQVLDALAKATPNPSVRQESEAALKRLSRHTSR